MPSSQQEDLDQQFDRLFGNLDPAEHIPQEERRKVIEHLGKETGLGRFPRWTGLDKFGNRVVGPKRFFREPEPDEPTSSGNPVLDEETIRQIWESKNRRELHGHVETRRKLHQQVLKAREEQQRLKEQDALTQPSLGQRLKGLASGVLQNIFPTPAGPGGGPGAPPVSPVPPQAALQVPQQSATTPEQLGPAAAPLTRQRTKLNPDDEEYFQEWFAEYAAKTGGNPNPDDPKYSYDYRGAWKAGREPTAQTGWHGDSRWKDDDEPRRFLPSELGIFDTKYSNLVTPAEFAEEATPAQQQTLKSEKPLPANEVRGYLQSGEENPQLLPKKPVPSGAQPTRALTEMGPPAAPAQSEVSRSLIEPFKETGKSLLFRGPVKFFDYLDEEAQKLSKASGLSYGGLFKQVADLARQRAEGNPIDPTMATRVYKDVAEWVTAEGPKMFGFTKLLGMLPGFAAYSAYETARQPGSTWKDSLLAAIKGALFGGELKALSVLGVVPRTTLGGATFAGQAAAEGERQPEKLTEEALKGGIFMAPGPVQGQPVRQPAARPQAGAAPVTAPPEPPGPPGPPPAPAKPKSMIPSSITPGITSEPTPAPAGKALAPAPTRTQKKTVARPRGSQTPPQVTVPIETTPTPLEQPKRVEPPVAEKPQPIEQGLVGKPTAPTAVSVQDLHRLAEEKGLKWDKDKTFMALTEQVTGKKHLDELSPAERLTFYNTLNRIRFKPQVTATTARAPAPVSEPILSQPRSELPPDQNQTILAHAEKAQADLEIAGRERGGKVFLEQQGKGSTPEVRGLKSPTAPWYKELTTGERPLKRQQIETAIQKIIQDEGLDRGKAVERVKEALLGDPEFAGTPWGKRLEAFRAGKPVEPLPWEAESEPAKKGQTEIPVPAQPIGAKPIIGREAQPEEAPLFSKAAQAPEPEQPDLSMMKIEGKGGETRAAAGMDPRMMKVLGGNLYSGNLGKVAVKEMLQNAVDSVRGEEGGRLVGKRRVDVEVNTQANSIRVEDNGSGMTPEVAMKELVDIGGSQKPEGASGGFGIAKVAIFANAAEIEVKTVAQLPNGKRVRTTLRGTGADWMDPTKGLEVHSESTKDEPGTTMAITLNRETPLDKYQIQAWLGDFQFSHRLPVMVKASVDGIPIASEDLAHLGTLKPTVTIPFEGGTVDFLLSGKSEEKQAPSVQILNNGLPQFAETTWLGESLQMPKYIVADIHPAASPEHPNYPFRPDRQGLRGPVIEVIHNYVTGELAQDAATRERARYKRAIEEAPEIPSTPYKVIDTAGLYAPELVDGLARKPYVQSFAKSIGKVFSELQRSLLKGNAPIGEVDFRGFGLGDSYLGLNISGKLMSGTEEARNLVLINPFAILSEVHRYADLGVIAPHEIAETFAQQTVATLLHELSHQQARGHTESFAGALTRNQGKSIMQSAAAAEALLETIQGGRLGREHEHVLGGLTADLAEISKGWKGGADVFGKISAAARRSARPPRREGDLTGRTEPGRERRTPLPGSPPSAAAPVAGGPTARQLQARVSERGSAPVLGAEAVAKGLETAKAVKTDLQTLLAPSTVTEAARRQARIMRPHLAELARQTERASETLKKAAKTFHKMPIGEQYEFIYRMEEPERGPQPTPELTEIAGILRAMLDGRLKEVWALGTGKLQQFIEDYFPHIWKDPKKAASLFAEAYGKRPLEGSKAFLRKRSIPTTREGIEEHHLEPVSTNPVDLVLLKLREIDRYLMGQRVFAEMKEQGHAKFVKFGKGPPEGWQKIHDKIAKVYQYSKTEKGFVARGEYYAPEGAARVLNNYLSPGLKGKVLYDMYRGAGNLLNQAQLGLSAFHLGFVTVDTQVSQASVGLQQAVAGKPAAAAKSLLTFPTAPFTAFRTGSKVTKEYLNPGSQGQAIGKIVSDLLQAGGRVKQDVFYRNSAIASFWDAIHEAKYGKATLQTFPALLEYTSRPVFEYLVPRMKLGVFARLGEFELSKLGKNASLDDQRRVLQRAWDSVENRLGMMTYDNLFWHKTLKDVLMASVRSVGWNLGTIRELGGGAFVDTPEQVLKLVTGKKPELTPRMAYVLALPMVTALYGAIYHYLATGEGPEDLKDYYFPKTGALRPDGSEDRISLPTYMKDVYAYGKHPLVTASHKANPSVGIVLDMLRNEDFYGAEIVNPDDPLVDQMKQVAQYVIESFTPFGVRNIRQQMRVGVPGPQAAQTFVGITPAPASVSRTPEAEAAWDLRRRKKAMRKRLKREQEPGLIDLMYGE